jgi:hypothetical protein
VNPNGFNIGCASGLHPDITFNTKITHLGDALDC